MKKLINLQHHYETGLLLELLEHQDIEAVLDESNVGVMDVISGQTTAGYDILVEEKDFEKAIEIVKAYLEGKNE